MMNPGRNIRSHYCTVLGVNVLYKEATELLPTGPRLGLPVLADLIQGHERRSTSGKPTCILKLDNREILYFFT